MYRKFALAIGVFAVAILAFVAAPGDTGKAALARADGEQVPAAMAESPPLGALPPDVGRPEAFALDPHSPQIVYLMTQGHVFKTTDGGAHWQATATSGSRLGWEPTALAADPRHPGTLYAGTQAAVYKTVDGGRSWRPSHRGLFVPHFGTLPGWVIALAVDPANTNIVYAGSDRVSKSSRWRPQLEDRVRAVAHAVPTANVSALAIAPTRPEAIYAIKSDFAHGRTAIYKSTDAGTSWQATTSVRGTYATGFATALAVDPRHPTTVYAAIGGNVLKTTNAGGAGSRSHTDSRSRPPARGSCHCQGGVTALSVDPRRTGTVYAALTPGGIYKTTTGGQTWTRAIDTQFFALYAVAVEPRTPGNYLRRRRKRRGMAQKPDSEKHRQRPHLDDRRLSQPLLPRATFPRTTRLWPCRRRSSTLPYAPR